MGLTSSVHPVQVAINIIYWLACLPLLILGPATHFRCFGFPIRIITIAQLVSCLSRFIFIFLATSDRMPIVIPSSSLLPFLPCQVAPSCHSVSPCLCNPSQLIVFAESYAESSADSADSALLIRIKSARVPPDPTRVSGPPMPNGRHKVPATRAAVRLASSGCLGHPCRLTDGHEKKCWGEVSGISGFFACQITGLAHRQCGRRCPS